MKRNRETGSNGYNTYMLLKRAAKYNSLSDVQELLAREDVSVKNSDVYEGGKTALHHACQDGDGDSSSLAIIKLLLEHGANINSTDINGATPLHLALHNKHSNNNYYLERIKLLIEKGADANAKNDNGYTPFHWACSSRYAGPSSLREEVRMLLIQNGADVNLKDNEGGTPLHWACHRGDLKMLKFLSNNGADASIPMMIVKIIFFNDPARGTSSPRSKFPPGKREHSRPVQELMEKLRDNKNDANRPYYRLPPLHWACLNDHFDMVQFLIENGGGDVDVLLQAKDEYGMTPLHWPSFVGSLEMVQFLVSRGAKANTKSKHGWTPLHFACNENHLEVVWFLVRQDPSLVLPSSLE